MKEMVTISFRITQEEKQALINYGKEQDLNMSQLIRKAIKELLSK